MDVRLRTSGGAYREAEKRAIAAWRKEKAAREMAAAQLSATQRAEALDQAEAARRTRLAAQKDAVAAHRRQKACSCVPQHFNLISD